MSEIIEREEIEVLIGNDTTNIYVESNGLVDRESLENDINSSVIEKRGVGGRKIEFGKIAFVPGDRDEMVEIVIESISKQLQ
jgi:RecJ-like exonuclease